MVNDDIQRGDLPYVHCLGNNSCYNAKPESSTSYQLHQRYYITLRKDLTCHRVKFWEDLVAQLWQGRAEGDTLIVCLDTNEHIYCKALGEFTHRSQQTCYEGGCRGLHWEGTLVHILLGIKAH